MYVHILTVIPILTVCRLVTFDSDNIAWSVLNGRVVTVTLLCGSESFCVNFEVSSTNRGNNLHFT